MDSDGMNRSFAPHVDLVGQDNLAAAERVLGLLSLLPPEEPPMGLLERTLAHIEGAVDTRGHRPFRSPGADNTTHA